MQNMTYILIFLSLGYSFYILLLYLFQRKIIYPGRKSSGPLSFSSQRQVIWIPTSFGHIESWFYPSPAHQPGNPAPVVFFAHGNRELIDDWPEALYNFLNLGLSLYLVEYPGYGRSPGLTNQKTITEAMVAAYDGLVEKEKIDPNQIVLFGRSLGGGAACALSDQRASAALILMSTFTSLRPYTVRFLFPSFLLLDTWDNLNIVRNYQHPVLIIHGSKDKIVPYKEGLKLSQKATNSHILTVRCEHNECPKDWETFWQKITSFLLQAKLIDQEKDSLKQS